MPLILALGTAAAAVVGLVFRDAADEVQQTGPTLTTLAALGIAGVAVWALVKAK